jgi:hypothetical protein
MKMGKALVSVLLVVAASVGWAGDIPDGKLGFPLGKYLTIEGKAAEGGFKVNPTCTLVVDTVNGKKLEKPIGVILDPLKGSLPQTGRITVRGYESGRMIGLPGEVSKAEEIMPPQAGWQFYRTFVITSWVQPKGPVVPTLAERRKQLAKERRRLLEKYRKQKKAGEGR